MAASTFVQSLAALLSGQGPEALLQLSGDHHGSQRGLPDSWTQSALRGPYLSCMCTDTTQSSDPPGPDGACRAKSGF